MQRFALALILILGLAACQTPASPPPRPAATAPAAGSATPAGYFVALAADGEAKAFYQRLYALIDTYNRRLAREAGALPAYADAFAADGHARLGDGRSEIECDREKCLVKVAARILASRDPTSLSAQLSRALGAAPLARDGLRIGCAGSSPYRCIFDLGHGGVASAELARGLGAEQGKDKGRLVDCTLAPGVTRSAQETSRDDGARLLKLTHVPGDGTETVGYLLYTGGGKDGVELRDLFLCGDLSADHFQVGSPAKAPRAWFGGALTGLTADDAELAATAKPLDGPADGPVTVEVRFRVQGADAVGADRFYVRFERLWLR